MRTLSLVLILVLLYGCATTPPWEPLKVERQTIIQEVKTIGLMPMSLPGTFEKADQITAEFESYITEKLREGNFQVIPSSRHTEIFESMKTALAPLYDPNTGKILQEKRDALMEHTKREYLGKYDPDALLYSAVRSFQVNWYGSMAHWHGADEPTTGKAGFWAGFGAGGKRGTMPALSLVVSMENRQGQDYYVNFGGIQLLQWLKGMKFVNVPANQLLVHSERNRRAVEIALAPLLGYSLDDETEPDL